MITTNNGFSVTPKTVATPSELPNSPGVYIYKDVEGSVIYVGKAKNLRNRVRSYFSVTLDATSKTHSLVQSIQTIHYIEVLSEFEALLLEAELIKKFRPKYNISLKDDKSFLYIVIRSEKLKIRTPGIPEGKVVTLPKIVTARKQDLKKSDLYFGPYPDGNTAKSVVRSIRRFLPYRDCSTAKFQKYSKSGQPCLYGHIGLCQAPCVGRISPENYKKEIQNIKKLLSGDSSKFIKTMERDMLSASAKQNYEEAQRYKETLEKFDYVRTKYQNIQKYVDNPYLVEDLREKSLEALVRAIPILKSDPYRIECYDISNIQGTDSVGSMVVAINGEITKKEYRKFKIKSKQRPDDFGMMNEVLTRRLKREWALPDLLVVDGGSGQVGAALNALAETEIEIPVVGLAKKQEIIVYFDGADYKEIKLPRDDAGLQLLQRLRDEAHRFAQSYHHLLRSRKIKL